MMPFFFVVKIIPTAGTPRAGDISGAYAHVWVIAKSLEEAEAKARSYLMDYAWVVEAIESALRITEDIISRLGEEERALFAKAQHLGIAADILAWPEKSRPSHTPAEVRAMGPPCGIKGGSRES